MLPSRALKGIDRDLLGITRALYESAALESSPQPHALRAAPSSGQPYRIPSGWVSGARRSHRGVERAHPGGRCPGAGSDVMAPAFAAMADDQSTGVAVAWP